MDYRKLLVTTVSASSVLSAGATASDLDQSKYIKLASISPIAEVAGDILVSIGSAKTDEDVKDECVAKGFVFNGSCPIENELCVTERCEASPSVGYNYTKCECYCNGKNTCKDMGFPDESCGKGYYIEDTCPIKPSQVRCAENSCAGYSSNSCSSGYILKDTCWSGTVEKYKCDPNPCSGYVTSCDAGYVLDSSNTCLSGSTTKYKCKVNPCSEYPQTSACSPIAGYVQTTCLSGSTTKYKCLAKTCPVEYNKTTPCSPIAGYTQTTCLEGSTTKYKCVAKTCPAEYNKTSACSPVNGYTQTTCLTGSTTKYKCVANLCSGYYTSCNTGYYLNTSQSCQAGATTKYKCAANPCTGYTYTSCPAGYTQTDSCQSGSTVKYKCACHSDCHTCTDDLSTMSNVSIVTSESGLRRAVTTANKTVAVLSNVTLTSNLTPASGVKIVGPKYFTSSAKCSARTTPVLNTKNFTVTMNNNTIEDMNLEANRTNTDYSKIMLAGTGTVKNTPISFKGYAGIVANADGSGKVINFDGTTSLNLITPDSSASQSKIQAMNGGTINIKNKFNVTGTNSVMFYAEDSTLNVTAGGELNYQAGAGSNLFEVKNSTIKLDGPVKTTNLKTVYSYNAFYQVFELWRNSSLYLNANGNILDATGYGFYHVASGYGGRIDINGSTTINMKYDTDGTKQEMAFKIDNGNYHDPAGYILNLNAPVTITGLETYSGSYMISQGDHMMQVLDATVNFNSTLTSTGGYGTLRGWRASLNHKSGSYISGVNEYEYSVYSHSGGTPKISISSGARLKIKGTCKQATSSKTITSGSDVIWTSPNTSYFSGSCSTTTPDPCSTTQCEIDNNCPGLPEPNRTICKTCCRGSGGAECNVYDLCPSVI